MAKKAANGRGMCREKVSGTGRIYLYWILMGSL